MFNKIYIEIVIMVCNENSLFLDSSLNIILIIGYIMILKTSSKNRVLD